MAAQWTVVGLGEALFDLFPDRQVLGGATLNVAVHVHQLLSAGEGTQARGRGVVVSRVGQDDLGENLLGQLRGRGMTTDYVQTDPDKPTGKVYVGLDEQGQPSFDIVRDVAWDWLQYDPDLDGLAQHCEAVCFGTLAQREGQARNTVHRFLQASQRAIRLFDVNLRQNYFDARVLKRSCEAATVVKLNRDELPVVCGLLGVGGDVQSPGSNVQGLGGFPHPTSPAPRRRGGGDSSQGLGADSGAEDAMAMGLVRKFKLKLVVLTRGKEGTALYAGGKKIEGKPVSYPMDARADAVGAGDACSAGVLVGLLMRWPMERVVDLANHMGAYVASQPGATPTLEPGIKAMLVD